MLLPDRNQIEIFVEALFRHVGTQGFVSLRSFYEDDSASPRINPMSIRDGILPIMERAERDARQAANDPKPVVFAPPIATFSNREHARKIDILQGLTLSVECDQFPQAARERLEQILGPATIVVTSGGKWTDPATGQIHDKLHLHWRLARPAEGASLTKLEQARDLATRLVGGDPSNRPICHPIRWPGSWHRKAEPRMCVIADALPDSEINLDTALAALVAASPAQKSNGHGEPFASGEKISWQDAFTQVLTGSDYHTTLASLSSSFAKKGIPADVSYQVLEALLLNSTPTAPDREQRRRIELNKLRSTVSSGHIKFYNDEQEARGTNGQQAPADLDEWDAGDDPGPIPPRQWLLANQFCRGFISSVVAAGGGGKTALRTLQFISLATGRELCGQHVFRRGRVLVISLEDDRNEMERRITATLKHNNISRSELKGWLFYATPRLAKLAIRKGKFDRIAGPLEAQIRAAIERRKPDLISFDPFIKTHSLEENDSGDMDFVCALLTNLGNEFNIAVDSPHHVHKGTITPGDADSGRGSSGIRDAGRLVYTLATMSEVEAKQFNIPIDTRWQYVRLDSAKVNIAPPAGKATWFKLVGVPIGNATEEYPSGDTVQVVEPWTPPVLMSDIEVKTINWILDAIGKGMPNGQRYSAASSATTRAAWKKVQDYCPDKGEGQCREIIKAWVKTGLLCTRDYDDPVRRDTQEGLFVDDEKRPAPGYEPQQRAAPEDRDAPEPPLSGEPDDPSRFAP
jgi:hypothetical protein